MHLTPQEIARLLGERKRAISYIVSFMHEGTAATVSFDTKEELNDAEAEKVARALFATEDYRVRVTRIDHKT